MMMMMMMMMVMIMMIVVMMMHLIGGQVKDSVARVHGGDHMHPTTAHLYVLCVCYVCVIVCAYMCRRACVTFKY
jgi:hypothetical protein